MILNVPEVAATTALVIYYWSCVPLTYPATRSPKGYLEDLREHHACALVLSPVSLSVDHTPKVPLGITLSCMRGTIEHLKVLQIEARSVLAHVVYFVAFRDWPIGLFPYETMEHHKFIITAQP